MEATATTDVLSLTEGAIDRFKRVMETEKLGPETGVRVAVVGGGCSGMSYSLSFETAERPGDVVLDQGGLRVFVDRESLPHVEGTVIDYVVGLHREGFKFSNPRAARTCGCGESFGV
jgi:iron-sulfur cluster assembly protein